MEIAVTDANKLRESTANIELYVDEKRVNLTFSGGLIKHDTKQSEPDLLKRVDKLLYQAKNQGKDRIVYA